MSVSNVKRPHQQHREHRCHQGEFDNRRTPAVFHQAPSSPATVYDAVRHLVSRSCEIWSAIDLNVDCRVAASFALK